MPSLSPSTLTLVVVLLTLIFAYNINIVYGDELQQDSCFRRCGVHNITHPFRLKDSPKRCGDKRYILSCENNKLILYHRKILRFFDKGRKKAVKYYVQSINYNNFTIRLLDFNLGYSNNSLPPYYSLGHYNFSDFFTSPYLFYQYINHSNNILTKSMVYASCPRPIPLGYVYPCVNSSTLYSQYRTTYRNVGGYRLPLSDLGLEDGCRIEFMYLTSWWPLQDGNFNVCPDVRRMIFYGFELSWINSFCKNHWYGKNWDGHCQISFAILEAYFGAVVGFLIYTIILKFVLGAPCMIVLLIYKLRRKHLSMYDNIEDFLRSDNSIMPIRYSYKDIKNITEKFKTKLGSGGYGSVFKGKLRSGRFVAVKLLDKGKSDGQDFVNEVATIGRIHHVNVVQLIGFCVEGSKRALIYEFMPNGSLEKYIFSHIQESNFLSCENLYAISLGVARGIEYLHNGCNMKILHFDIKPHNILLDENFNPKVSDFGLARLCPTDKSIVSLTAARGTIGYMAPELFYRNIGTISYKADVYSFGMLLMEMASRRKNLNALAEKSSKIYFPFWIYDQLHDGKEVTIENDTIEEMKLAKKMMIVALWCIQTKPNDRPSMDKVLEMLEEEDGDLLQIPNKPYFCLQDEPVSEVGHDNIISSLTSSMSDSNEPIT